MNIMDNKISTAVIYYTITTILALAFCWTLIVALNWPALAEIPLVVAIFIQILALSKASFRFWNDHKEHFLDGVLSKVKAALFSLDTQEEEVNI